MKRKTEVEVKPKGEIIIDKDAKPFTPEVAVRCVFGISLQEIVKEIRENRGGKYDGLYID